MTISCSSLFCCIVYHQLDRDARVVVEIALLEIGHQLVHDCHEDLVVEVCLSNDMLPERHLLFLRDLLKRLFQVAHMGIPFFWSSFWVLTLSFDKHLQPSLFINL